MKAAAAELGLQRVTDLLVLDRKNDPFMMGGPADRRDAEWFADLWQRYGYDRGVHIRRIHYRHLSDPNAVTSTGAAYENTTQCEALINGASKKARVLDLVDPAAFDDRRNDPPVINASPRTQESDPDWLYREPDPWRLPTLNPLVVLAPPRLSLGSLHVEGYDFHPGDTPYHLEVFIEKSTMNDVLRPVCQSHGMNLTYGAGFESITHTVEFLHRAAEIVKAGRPARIFYISDFDPAGSHMPTAVARQIQFFLDTFAPDADIALTPVALTREQVQLYELPRTPIKASDNRRHNFEARHGEGAVELDALEALHPGELGQIVGQAAAPYLDPDLPGRLAAAERDAQRIADEEWSRATSDLRDELSAVRSEVNEVVSRYRGRLETISSDLDAELAPYRERLDEIAERLAGRVDELDIALPDRPVGGAAGAADEHEWLYRSDRHWREQLDRFRQEKNGGRS